MEPKCKLCGEAVLGDLAHVVERCSGLPEALKTLRASILAGLGADEAQAIKKLRRLDYEEKDEDKLVRALVFIRKSSKFVSPMRPEQSDAP